MVIEIILGLIVITEGYVIWNLTTKQEMLEDWVEDFIQSVEKINFDLKQVDYKGSFEADDEVGFFFTELKELNSILNNLFTQEVDDATIKEEEKKEE